MVGAQPDGAGQPLKIVEPKTKRGKRVLQKRAPKLVEDARRVLLLHGNKSSQILKDVFVDLQKLKWMESVKYTRKNQDVRPFEAGGEVSIEHWARKGDCTMFALATHTKKRPHNLVLGRLYDYHVFDMLEFGVERFTGLTAHKASSTPQLGNKLSLPITQPCFAFQGDGFDRVPALTMARSMLLDLFRGAQVPNINLGGLDRVMFVTHVGDDLVLLRQYRIKLKRSGTKIPRVELEPCGPSMDLRVRRVRAPPHELQQEAMKQPKELKKKKEKNVGEDMLDGKVGRIYMPKQTVDGIALRKMKGLKRERREAAAAASDARKKQRAGLGDEEEGEE